MASSIRNPSRYGSGMRDAWRSGICSLVVVRFKRHICRLAERLGQFDQAESGKPIQGTTIDQASTHLRPVDALFERSEFDQFVVIVFRRFGAQASNNNLPGAGLKLLCVFLRIRLVRAEFVVIVIAGNVFEGRLRL